MRWLWSAALVCVLIGRAAAQSPDFTVNELADESLVFSFYAPLTGKADKAATLRCQVHDQTTGQLLWDPGVWTVAATSYPFVIPAASNGIVRPGTCSVTATTVCSSDAGCPAGETCFYAITERHLLNCLWTRVGGGQGTWEIPFDVRSQRFLPFP